MSSGNVEVSVQPKDGDIESQNEKLQGMEEGIVIGSRQVSADLKFFEILKSALKIFTSNTKFMFLMILSILPFLVFMVFCEMKLQKTVVYVSSNSILYQNLPGVLSITPSNSTENTYIVSSLVSKYYWYDDYDSYTDERREFYSDALQLFLFYFLLYPFLEFLSLSITMKIATKVHEAEKQTTIKEFLPQIVDFKGPFITYLYVHLLSSMTLFGLIWIVFWNDFLLGILDFEQSINIMSVLFVAIHLMMVLALLYKYLGWSAFWNMGMAISFAEGKTGIAALGLSDYYGRHCKKTGFQLMLSFFVFENLLRLPCLYAGLCNGYVTGVLVTSTVMALVSIGNLVKWVAFLLYFYYCKQQTMEKKVDDRDLGKIGKAAGDQS